MDPVIGTIAGGAISAGASYFGGQSTAAAQQKIAEENIAYQKDFARNALSWRAEDATDAQRATGINRLTLLGAPTSSFSNVVGASDAGAGLRDAGQNIGRAIAAASAIDERARELDAKLVQAKIDNVNADTTRMMAAASGAAIVNQPGTPPPMPTPDPRGPVINLMQRARDPRTGEIVWIPSEKAASPLQTLAASSTNAALAGRSLSEGLMGFPGGSDSWWPFRRDAWKGVDLDQYSPYLSSQGAY